MLDNDVYSSVSDSRFEAVLAEIIQAEEQGQAIDARHYLDSFPELAEPLRDYFRDREWFPRLAKRLAPTGGHPEVPAPQPELPPSSHFGDYEILHEIGRGGRGIVYRVNDPELNRPLAVKVLRPELRDEPDAVRRFLEEAQVMGQLQHPNIVPVHAIGRLPDGRLYFAMRLVQGRTLAELLAERPAPSHDLPRFLTVIQQVCQAVAYAHSRRVIHRDLKPANVMVGTFAEVQVMDWGLTKVLTADEASQALQPSESGASASEITNTIRTLRTEETGLSSADGLMVGTISYLSPEQAKGQIERVDRRADVFGLGAVLCEVLTGQPPYTGAAVWKLHLMAAEGDLADAFARLDRCGTDAELIALAKDCLAPERERRPRDAGEVAARLATYLAGVQERFRQAEIEKAAEQARAEEAGLTAAAEHRARRRTRALAGVITAASILMISTLAVSTVLIAGALSTAESAQKITEDEKRETQKALERERRIAHANRMNLAQIHWRESRVVRVLDLLNESRSSSATHDENLCGFTWHYLRRLCHQEERTLHGNIGPLFGMAISPDGRLLAAAGGSRRGQSGEVKVWDVASGREMFTLRGHPEAWIGIIRVVFSADGKQLSIRDSRKLMVFDVSTRQQRFSLSFNSLAMTYSPDGKYLAGSIQGGALLRDAVTGQEMMKLSAPNHTPRSIAFSPDSRRLAIGGDDTILRKATVKIWDVENRQVVLTLLGHKDYIQCIAFSPDGRMLASGGLDKTVRLSDVVTGNVLHVLKGHTGDVSSLAFSPDGRTLASADSEFPDGDDTARCVKVWDVVSGRELRTLRGHTGAVSRIAFFSDGRLASCSLDGTVKIWGRDAGCDYRFLHEGRDPIIRLAVSGDGKFLAWANREQITVFGLPSGQILRRLSYPKVRCVAFSSDGRFLAFSSLPDNVKPMQACIKLWDLQMSKEHWVRSVKAVADLVFSGDGRYLASADRENGTVTLWDAATGDELRTLKGHQKGVSCVAFTPDGRLLATSSGFDGTVRLWDTTTGHEQQCLIRKPTYRPYRLAFSPDGHRLAAILNTLEDDVRGGSVGIIQVWDLATRETLLTLRGHTRQILALAFSPNSQCLVTGSADRTAKIWDIISGQELLTLAGHDGGVHELVFSSDGHRLFTADSPIGNSRAKTLLYDYEAHRTYGVRVWDATPLPKEADVEALQNRAGDSK